MLRYLLAFLELVLCFLGLRPRAEWGWGHNVRVIVVDERTGEVTALEALHNKITDAGLVHLVSALESAAFDAELKYMAWGDDASAPAAGDTTLGNELGRKQVTKQEAGSTGEMVTTTILQATEANVQIEELGFFAGAGASATKDSGTLIARVLYSKLKTNSESIQVERTDTLSEAP